MRQLYRPSLVRRWERERAERTTHIEKTLSERPAHPFPRKAAHSRRSTALECSARLDRRDLKRTLRISGTSPLASGTASDTSAFRKYGNLCPRIAGARQSTLHRVPRR